MYNTLIPSIYLAITSQNLNILHAQVICGLDNSMTVF
jgi:hypothetical protein